MRLPSSNSNAIGPQSLEDPESAAKEVEEESRSSPIRWGYLGATAAHLACIFITGLPTSHPWVCVHGVINIGLTCLLGYIAWMWNTRFNNDTYIRRQLMRFSFAVVTTLVGLFCGHTTLLIAFYGPEGDDGICGNGVRDTPFGCMARMSIGTPIVYGILIMLWLAFSYIQFVAVSNLEALRPKVPETTTIGEEIRNSLAAGNHQRQLINTCRSGHPSIYFYSCTLIPSAVLWACGLTFLEEQLVLAIAAILSASLILAGLTSLGTRSNLYAIIGQSALLAMGVAGLLLSMGESQFTTRGARITAGVIVLLFQIVALVASASRYRNHREVDRARHKAAPEHFFRANRSAAGAQQVADPIDFFAAGVAGREKPTPV